MSDHTIRFTPQAASSSKQQWAKKISQWIGKNHKRYGEVAAAFGTGLLSYNLLFSFKSDGTSIQEDAGEYNPLANDNSSLEEEVMHQFHSSIASGGAVAATVSDDMNFGEAFQAARAELGAGNFFMWRGRLYNNYTESEYLDLSPTEKEALLDRIAGVLDKNEIHAFSTESEETVTEISTKENPNLNTTNQNMESLESTTEKIEYLDKNNDGERDGALINNDGDPQAEFVMHWNEEAPYAFADTSNTGYLDTIFMIDENGHLTNPLPISDPIPAPKLTTHQLMDLIGNDGILDSKASDTHGDNRAETVEVDLNGDGNFDFAYCDSTGDGQLDKVYNIVDGQLSGGTDIEPFASPIVSIMSNPDQMNNLPTEDVTTDRSDDDNYDDGVKIEGMEHDSDDMDDFN